MSALETAIQHKATYEELCSVIDLYSTFIDCLYMEGGIELPEDVFEPDIEFNRLIVALRGRK